MNPRSTTVSGASATTGCPGDGAPPYRREDSVVTTVDRPDATYIPRCRDVVLWVCGTEKLYDLGAGWL
ncbi:hypothetical protein SAMN04489732_13011 [Amycolatopsis saalfeldensis]|uniref:Uncharacterized protein n=1 Tax=Amycolatopsis saalfeldensis TaxID=394193 RepID=A0A1H8YNI2_9PSEU|nr:hypothetical protein SAMN04489732_13011 [Amycolatopsis saalfeldensis]